MSKEKKVTKLVSKLKNLDNATRLGLTTLKARRERGDAIEYFKISGRLNKVNFVRPNLVAYSTQSVGPAQGIRGNQYRLDRQKVKGYDQRNNYFSNRIVTLWNCLPLEVANSITTNQFKARYDKHLNDGKKCSC